ncbi:MAG: excinuclease ABC subunit UvrC [bacterium]
MPRPDLLKDKLDHLPKSPGVYLFKDKNGRIIYVGKAKVLRHRVRSYFQKGEDNRYQYQRLVNAISDLEIIVTDTEMEALILESNLIKKNAPRYNVNLRDDKTYPYIKVTGEPFPRIFLTRKPTRDGSRYYGPYTDVKNVRQLLRTFKGVLKIRNCNRVITPELIAAKKYRPCLNYHIGRCAGACSGLISEPEYRINVQHFVNLLQGRDKDLIEYLRAQMQSDAAELRFEEAAAWRDRLKKVESFSRSTAASSLDSTDLRDWDVIALALEDDDGCAALFRIRAGKILGRSHFYLNHVFEKSSAEVLEAFLKEYYSRTESIPDVVLLPMELDDQDLIARWLTQNRNTKVITEAPKIGEKARLVRLVGQNAELLLGELKLQKSKKDFVHHAVKSLQRDLNLPRLPQRIEAFDVSNIQGKDAVASLVCFKNAQPAKSEYRRFKIRTVAGADDFAMMGEAIQRRYRRILKEKQPLPDLILVDGGKGQLNRAVEVLTSLGLSNVPAVGLAKKLEEVFVPGSPDPQNLPKVSSSLKLLCQIRDEAHRFAIEYHRKLRGKRVLSGELESISGIGKARRSALLRHFGSLKKLKEADLDAIIAAPGISRELAKRIHRHFHPQ